MVGGAPERLTSSLLVGIALLAHLFGRPRDAAKIRRAAGYFFCAGEVDPEPVAIESRAVRMDDPIPDEEASLLCKYGYAAVTARVHGGRDGSIYEKKIYVKKTRRLCWAA